MYNADNSYSSRLSIGWPSFRHVLRCYHTGTITAVTIEQFHTTIIDSGLTGLADGEFILGNAVILIDLITFLTFNNPFHGLIYSLSEHIWYYLTYIYKFGEFCPFWSTQNTGSYLYLWIRQYYSGRVRCHYSVSNWNYTTIQSELILLNSVVCLVLYDQNREYSGNILG